MRVFVFLVSGIWENGSVAFFHMNLFVFLKNCFFNQSVVFFASGILGDGISFPWRIVFSMRVLVFLASGILEDGSVAFCHMNF